MLGVLGRSDVEDPSLERSADLPDQLKALRLARCGGISVSVLSGSSAGEGTGSDFSEVSDSCFDSLGSTTVSSALAKNLRETPKESEHRAKASAKLITAFFLYYFYLTTYSYSLY